jgi:hypothetical protein
MLDVLREGPLRVHHLARCEAGADGLVVHVDARESYARVSDGRLKAEMAAHAASLDELQSATIWKRARPRGERR